MKVSIITVCFNAGDVIGKTIKSIIEQDYNNFEFIIVDGLSVDNTKDIIEENINNIDVFVSEKDLGIYDAMNKGIKLSSGDWLIFMNAGDVFASPDVISHVVDYIHKNKNINLLYGNYIITNIEKHQKLSLTFLMSHMLNHQSVFYHSSVIKSDIYNLKYKFCADYAHLINVFPKIKAVHLNKAISIYDNNGISSQDRNKYKMWLERLDAVWVSDLNITTKIYLSLRGVVSLPYQYIKTKVLYR
ncbi:TPA: glycosyltransferase family 2 protein [Photobacterium damselae]